MSNVTFEQLKLKEADKILEDVYLWLKELNAIDCKCAVCQKARQLIQRLKMYGIPE